MGERELVESQARRAESEIAEALRERFPEPVLARLWAAEQVRRAADDHVGELLQEAHDGDTPQHFTWEELGMVLGMSAQGARQRMLRWRAVKPPP
ncbi:hypothetical protein [Actinosynnema sp. NPDC020468]|uniref:hypothetical protein n=1 Tax=Actinosynnema sp. NPDC020468 TaxID=3154488 RepID=UPI0034049C9D